MAGSFRGTVRKAYRMGEHRALVLDDRYEGDVESGDRLEVELPSGRTTVEVVSLAWGSAFRADSPPLTLVVQGLDESPPEGAAVRTPGED